MQSRNLTKCFPWFIALLLCVPSAFAQAPIELISYSNIYADIVVADNPAGCAVEAAGILQNTLYRITGQRLNIRTESEYQDDPDRYRVAILVGNSRMAKEEMGVEVQQDRDAGDYYVIKADGDRRRIVLAGNDDGSRRGTVYAVYDLLERRFGCGWYTPDSLWQVIPKYPQASVVPMEVHERAAFVWRHIWEVTDPVLKDAWRLGGRQANPPHALGWLVPRQEYQKEHPEYFGPIQPCLTNPEVIKIAADACRQKIDKYPKGIVDVSLSPIDDGGFCDCQRCQAAGNISARMLFFANEVAKNLDHTHRGKYLLVFLAYWHTHAPPDPMLKAEASVCVMQVNEGDHLHPWDQPEWPGIESRIGRNNTREVKAFKGWQQAGSLFGIYEWWIPGQSSEVWRKAPWYSGETALRNLRYWRKGGIKYVTYESKSLTPFGIAWPLYHVGAKGLWNPDLTSAQIMGAAYSKLYGPAGEEMSGFYQVLEKAAYNNTMRGKNWGLPTPVGFYTRQVVAEASRHMDKAATLTEDQTILTRIAQERQMWDQAVALMETMRIATVVMGDKSKDWHNTSINGNNVRWLYGIPYSRPLYAVSPDGIKSELGDTQDVELTEGVWFSTEP